MNSRCPLAVDVPLGVGDVLGAMSKLRGTISMERIQQVMMWGVYHGLCFLLDIPAYCNE